MQLLDQCEVRHGESERRIELLYGDLARLPPDHSVDILVASAFKDDYSPTTTSLIGALDSVGLSVQQLSQDKHVDLREQFSCWLSQPVDKKFNFGRILCLESDWKGSPPEIIDDLFRALAPFLLTEFSDSSVAIPVLGTGDQHWPFDEMLTAILTSAVAWINRGLVLKLLKIVVFRTEDVAAAQRIFSALKGGQLATTSKPSPTASGAPQSTQHDVFISYSRVDTEAAHFVYEELRSTRPDLSIFLDQTSIPGGASWLMHIAHALDSSKRVVALYSENYWSSNNCKDEFLAARARQIDLKTEILFPIYREL
jgi:hypothetical protein